MSIHYLSKLFTPKNLVVFGASERKNAVGEVVFRNILESGYAGKVYVVNPKHDQVQGHKAFKSLDEITETIDLAVVVTPAETIPRIVEACGEHGIKMMLVLSAGFREIGPKGRLLEDEMMKIVRRYNIRLMGPNCLGIIRPEKNINITFGYNNARKGNIALISQSGAICTAILDWAEANNIGFSAVVSTGIAADLDFGDYLDYLTSDPHTHSILLYIEGIKNSRRFMSSLRTAARIKPVIALKVGRHEAGAAASMSHTGALVGSDETFSAALARSGVLRVDSVSKLFSAAKALSSQNYRGAGDRLVIITNGGGPGVMAADRASDVGIGLSKLSPQTMDKLNQVLPSVWSHGNPIDVIGDAPPERYKETLDICLGAPEVDGIIVILTPQAMTDPDEVAKAVIKSSESSRKPILTSWMGGRLVENARQLFTKSNIPTFRTLENAIDAFFYMAAYNRNQNLLLQTPAKLKRSYASPDKEGARLIIESALNEDRQILTEPESIAVLRAFNIPCVQIAVAKSANEALIFAETIGFPIAMKILSTDISHKSDSGGVRLNIDSAQEVRSAYKDLIERVKQNSPEATIIGVTIGKMYRSTNGRELMVGILRDPVFGPVISFGSGGTSIEVMRDSAISLPPLNESLALDLINRTKVSKMLDKFRNLAAINKELLIEVLIRVSNLACELPWVVEMDINPLIVDDKEIVAVDARFRVEYPKPSTDPYQHLAIHPYPSHLIVHEQLNDGTNIIIRPIRPEDAEIEQKFIRELSQEAKYFRFMSSLQELSQEMLVRFTQIDYHNEMALIAVKTNLDLEEEIGVVRYITNLDNTSCEFALVISDKWQHKGIGHLMMNKLIQIARDRGFEKMEGEILSNNVKMLDLIKSIGFEISNDPDDLSIKHAVLYFH
ncbi:MAG: bifunctional acetate--CoA ligase family protein/GNAT family N-acetyltransferase [Gammaproteobacteria bacterium]|nr:bifunctional acetate--CoA ligase family protein/GNAT family N-acetyltransferase [Gammaproteobacteria bacterium]